LFWSVYAARRRETVDKEELKERLQKRLAEARAERERDHVHPRECKCGGHGNIPQAQFSIGYVRCDG
jgi:hypothetical protein